MELLLAGSDEARPKAPVLGDVKVAKAALAAGKEQELRDGTALGLKGATAQVLRREEALAARGVLLEVASKDAKAREKRPAESKDDLALAQSGLMDAKAQVLVSPAGWAE